MRSTIALALSVAFVVAFVAASASKADTMTGGLGSITDTRTWVCKPIKGNPSKERCTRR